MLLAKMPGADKETLVNAFTKCRTSSLREMTSQEYMEMIQHMDAETKNTPEQKGVHTRQQWRRMILAAIHSTADAKGINYTSAYALGIAKRASMPKDFNQLNEGELVRLYAHFLDEKDAIIEKKQEHGTPLGILTDFSLN